jgi:hypothetical protein
MEQIKYIPGDLVSVYVGVEKYIVKVIGIKTENEVFLYQIKFPNGEIQYADKDNIVPIPLTPEILDNNKWKRLKSKRYTWWRIRLDSVYYFIKPNKDCPSVWELCRGNTRRRFKKIKYVHQLQHFLFGLELNSDMNL